MPRRGNIARRDVLPDPLYNSKLVTRLINNIMLDGKKGVAQKIVYGAFDIVKEKTGKDPLEAFEQAMENIMPVLEIKARRVGGATYQVPMEVRPERRQTLGLRWLTTYSRNRSEKTDGSERLAGEIMDAMNGQRRRRARSARIPTRWPRPTRLLPISDGNSGRLAAFCTDSLPLWASEFANLLGGHYAKRCILRENA